MVQLRSAVSPEDYVLSDELTTLFGQSMYVLKHDPCPFPGNPTENPYQGSQEYNQRLLEHGPELSSSFTNETLTDALRAAEDDPCLAEGLLKIYRMRHTPGADLGSVFSMSGKRAFDLMRLVPEIQQMSARQVLELQNRVQR